MLIYSFLCCALLLVLGEESNHDDESLIGGVLHDVIRHGGVFKFRKGHTIAIESHAQEGPEKDPNYDINKYGDDFDFQNPIVTLTEQNFEHLTQAGSGMTTGHWFVLMSSPWCKYCTDMMPHWNRTAIELKGEINVAIIDASNAPFTSKRFNVTAYPRMVLMKNGHYWHYDAVNSPRQWRDFSAFARLTDTGGTPIPPAHDTWDSYVIEFWEYFHYLYRYIQRKPYSALAAALMGTLFGVVLPFGYVLTAPMDPTFPGINRNPEEFNGPKVWTDEATEAKKKKEE